MKKRLFGIISVILVVSITLMSGGGALAATGEEGDIAAGKAVVNAFGKVADALITFVARLFPGVDWPNVDDYVSEDFYEGTSSFATSAAQGSSWYAGYGSQSIVPDDLQEKGYTVAGEFHITEELCKTILDGDDQRVNAVALKTSGDGETVVFISIDGFGMSSTNVRKLRSELADYAAANNIVSINVTLTHAHSCIDTHGLGAGILGLLGDSMMRGLTKPLTLLGYKYDAGSSTDEAFMALVYSQAVKAVKTAVGGMQPGTMSFGSYDISDMLYDKQWPDKCDRNVNQIKFIPTNDSGRQIWLVNMGVHPVRMGGDGVVSSDYPGAIVRTAAKQNIDVAFYQGAQLAITRSEDVLDLGNDDAYNALPNEAEKSLYAVTKYGAEVVRRMLEEEPVESFAIEPVLNIRHTEVMLPVTNSLLLLIAKVNMINNIVVKTSFDFTDCLVVTEVGYCEMGTRLAIGLMPGELDPAIAFGGVDTAEASWNGTDWEYPAYKDVVGGRKLIMFGLTNDQIGYIIPDNDYAHAFASLFEDMLGGGRNKHYEEMISLGGTTASGVSKAFIDMVNATK